ncbi:MAG: Maf family protein [Pseudomonadota bacterium]
MTLKITLASTSRIRQQLLQAANVIFTACDSGFDEAPLKAHLLKLNAAPSEIALSLAAAKASALSGKRSGLVLGCDQVLAFEGSLLSKPQGLDETRDQLKALRGRAHDLLSAAVVFENGEQVWSHVGRTTLTMRPVTDGYLEAYLQRNWSDVQSSVGGYKLEEEGVRLFSEITGDYFTVLGMPLVEILGYFGERGAIDT